MNIKRGVILTFVGRRINSISSAKIQKTYAKYGKPFTKQRLLRSTLTIAATLLFTSSGYASTNTVSKKENDRTVNHRSLSDDNGRKWSRIFSKNTSIDSEKNLRLKIAQSSNIVDFISPFLKGFGYNKPQTSVKPLPTDNKPYQDNSAVQKQSEIPKVERSAKRPARAFCVRLCDGYYWPVDETALKLRAKSAAEFCASQCTSVTKVFLNHNPGSTAEHLIDKSGKRYQELENSFLYRKKYIPSCRCRPDPWESTEQKRHVKYEKTEKNISNNALSNKFSPQLDATSSAGWSVEISRPH